MLFGRNRPSLKTSFFGKGHKEDWEEVQQKEDALEKDRFWAVINYVAFGGYKKVN